MADSPDAGALLCRCPVCGREKRAGASPLTDGWPKCCGYTMTLVDERFIPGIDDLYRLSDMRAALSGSAGPDKPKAGTT